MKQSKTYRLISCFLIFGLLLSSFQTILASSEKEDKSQKQKINDPVEYAPNASLLLFQNMKGEVLETIKQYFEARYQNFVGLKASMNFLRLERGSAV